MVIPDKNEKYYDSLMITDLGYFGNRNDCFGSISWEIYYFLVDVILLKMVKILMIERENTISIKYNNTIK